MGKEKHRCSVNDLAVGMYVSELDRPWIETPFLFQGFHIESPDVIEELQKHCEHVFVDVAQSDTTIEIPREHVRNVDTASQSTTPGEHQSKAAARSRTLPVEDGTAGANDDTALMKAELSKARAAHEAADESVRNLFDKVKGGGMVDAASVQESVDPMIDSIMRNDDAMSWLARMKRKDDYVYDHSISSSVWALVFGKHLGLELEELRILGTGAIFMDVGKTRIPDQLLRKHSPLSEKEMQVMRTHVKLGLDITRQIKGIDERMLQMIAGHHERYNGTGYPRGLSGGDIPVFAKIAGIVDSYDAMTTPRPYAPPVSTYDAIRQLNKLAGVEFPQEIVEQFVQAIGVFPVGTLVELNTGAVGVVIAQNRVRRLRPKVMLLLDTDKTPLNYCETVDLRNQLADGSNNSLWIERGLTSGEYGLDPSEYYL